MISLANISGTLQQAMISGTRMFTFLNTSNVIRDPARPVPISGAPHLQLSGVTLQLDEKILLKHVDLDIPYGKSVGIMGKTGSGKSALLKTFMRFFEATRGVVKINGVDVKYVEIEALRRQFSYVPQDVFLFSNTVDSNIAFAEPDCPHEKVVSAAEAAEAADFIAKLPQGYGTVVGEKGLGLSGGQKQRVSIARALLKDAPVIILDDSTSALDLETERRIFNNLHKAYAGRTLLIAAHRASSVAECDEILYMEDGAIAERGTLSELLAQNGKFAAVYEAQSAHAADTLG
jgi:ATP-binding cassette subfamily B protein